MEAKRKEGTGCHVTLEIAALIVLRDDDDRSSIQSNAQLSLVLPERLVDSARYLLAQRGGRFRI
jgi:hypothetical protein